MPGLVGNPEGQGMLPDNYNMNNETYGALKRIIEEVKEKRNSKCFNIDCVVNQQIGGNDIDLVEGWIKETEKDHILNGPIKETLKAAGLKYIKRLGDREHLLYDLDTKKYEIWFANKNHASYGLIYKNTHLEFARSARKDIDNISGEIIYW